jgi:uncharacterized protein YdaU (DUF1376 family)
MARPWMPLYIGDYIADTRHLRTVQHGAYLLLMMHYWARGSLPDNDGQLARITGLPLKEWLRHRPVLQALFRDGWTHPRLDVEIAKTNRKMAHAKEAGSKGGTVTAIRNWRSRR